MDVIGGDGDDVPAAAAVLPSFPFLVATRLAMLLIFEW